MKEEYRAVRLIFGFFLLVNGSIAVNFHLMLIGLFVNWIVHDTFNWNSTALGSVI